MTLVCSTADANVSFPCQRFWFYITDGLAESWHLIVTIICHLYNTPPLKWNIQQMKKQIFYCKFVTPQCLSLGNSSANPVSYYSLI